MSGVGLTGEIVPLNGASFPVFTDTRGRGGWRGVTDNAARDGIPDNFRSVGMVVVNQTTGVAYKLDGGIDNADWVVFGGTGALVVPLFKNTFYVTSTATPAASVFTTLQAAVNAVVPGTPTQILAAPETYNEDVLVPHGLTVAITLYEYSGIKGAINGTVTWDVATPDFLSIEGFEIPGGIVQQDHGTTNGPATLRLANVFCDGITGTLAHAVVTLQAYGSLDGDCRLSGTSTVNNGNILLENAALLSSTTATPSLAMINSAINSHITAQTVVLIATEFISRSEITCSGTLYMDDYSGWQARAGLLFTGGGQINLTSGVSLEMHPAGSSVPSPSIDFTLHSAYIYALDQDTTPIFSAPLYSQVLGLTLQQGGAEHWDWVWPANVRNPPAIGGIGNTSYLLYYAKEVDEYYVFTQGESLAQHSIPFGGDSPTFDFSAHSSLVFGLDQTAAPTVIAPQRSKWLTLELLNGGGGPYQIIWPGNFFNPPGNVSRYTLPNDVNLYVIYYSKESDVYFCFGQTSNDQRNLSTVASSSGSTTTALDGLDLYGPRNKGSAVSNSVVFNPAAPITNTQIANVPEAGMVYEVNVALWVNAALTSGSVGFNVLWTDANGRARTKQVTSVSVGTTDFESGAITIAPLINTAITYEIVIGAPLVGGVTVDIGFGLTVMRLSQGTNTP